MSDRQEEIQQYIAAYRHPNYAMGVERQANVRKALSELKGGTLLDIGTGRGETLSMWRDLGFEATGTEVVPALLREGVVYAEGHALPFESRSFDHVTCFDVLEHLIEEDIRPTLLEMRRVARKTLLVSASELTSKFGIRELHISRRPKAEWLTLIRECWPGAQCVGKAGQSPLFKAVLDA